MILITGATGFVGMELALHLLELGVSFRCTRRPETPVPELLRDGRIDWREADLLDYFAMQAAFEDVDAVYHCAALVSFKPSDKQRLLAVNRDGTARLVNLCLEKNVRKLVFVSSVAALGAARPGKLITEKDHWQYSVGQGGYAVSKYEAEMEVWRGIAEGLNAVIVNPSVIIGARAGDRVSGQLFRAVRQGLRVYTSGTIGVVGVQDVARAMILLMQSDLSGERFILSAGSLSFRELFSQIAAAYGRRAPSFELRPWHLSVAWRGARLMSLLTGQESSLTAETAASAFRLHDYDNSKIQQALPGFRFTPVPTILEETAKHTQPT